MSKNDGLNGTRFNEKLFDLFVIFIALPKLNERKNEAETIVLCIEWLSHDNMFTVWPEDDGSIIVYEDDYFKGHTWYWGDNPHWAYNTEFMTMVPNRDAIEWTPNTIGSEVQINGHFATVNLSSDTPNLKTYQMKELPDENWKEVGETVKLDLKKKKHEFIFRTVNLAGIGGTEHKVVIAGD